MWTKDQHCQQIAPELCCLSSVVTNASKSFMWFTTSSPHCLVHRKFPEKLCKHISGPRCLGAYLHDTLEVPTQLRLAVIFLGSWDLYILAPMIVGVFAMASKCCAHHYIATPSPWTQSPGEVLTLKKRVACFSCPLLPFDKVKPNPICFNESYRK